MELTKLYSVQKWQENLEFALKQSKTKKYKGLFQNIFVFICLFLVVKSICVASWFSGGNCLFLQLLILLLLEKGFKSLKRFIGLHKTRRGWLPTFWLNSFKARNNCNQDKSTKKSFYYQVFDVEIKRENYCRS